MTRLRWAIVALVVFTAGGLALWKLRPDGPARSAAPPPATPPPAVANARGDVAIDTRRQQLLGVTTEAVTRAALAPEVRASGAVLYDETRQVEVNTRVGGWIRDLFADYTGKPVKTGEPLFTLYSQELLATENEYLLARRGHGQAGHAEVDSVRQFSDRLLQAARDRLLIWDLSPTDLEDLEEKGQASGVVTFRSPAGGVVVEKAAVKGMRVQAGQMLFRIADLSTVWVEAAIYERDLALVRVGAPATVTFDAYPGQSFTGRAAYVYPSLNEATRTGKVRFQLSNPGNRFKPGMFANVVVRAPVTIALSVPANAVIDSGTEQTVFIAQGDGYFTPRTVKVGRRVGDRTEIVEGVKEGEQVAASATFLLDSESQLRGGLQSYQAPAVGNTATSTTGAGLDIRFRPTSDPPRTGENTFEVELKDAGGRPVTDAEVSVRLFMPAMPTMNMPSMQNDTTLVHTAGGVYRGPGQVLMGGRWDVTVTARKGTQELGRKQFALVAK
jgi:Cu(I)/Ag(I) efflux system membrane fusion protein/cobalt-zinc-cadmium efflux system membrane fusion protein